jgi:UDP-N-acetyl-D-mannosaminuronate dehydrogenase
VHPTLKLHPLDSVLAQADLLVFLVAHSAFRGLELTGRQVFDLCGVTDR